MDDKLKPCPFCGGVAQRVDISADEYDPNAGGSYIACQFCLASSSIAFGDKSSLADNWNSRAGDARIRAEARAEALKEAADRAIHYIDNHVEAYGYHVNDFRAAILADEPEEIHGDGSGKALPPFDPSNERVCEAAYPDEPKEERGAEVASLIDLRNIIGGVGAADDNDSDNLAIALACYFYDRLDRPDDDEIDEETGWSKWVLKKAYSLMDRVVLAIIDRKPAEVERRIEEAGR